jgi:hypothetical protein
MTTKTIDKPQTETEKLFALDKPSLENLSYALRHPDTWPKGFVWDFGSCRQCAMGLAHCLWQDSIPRVNREDAVTVMAREFAMPYTAAQHIFMSQTGKKTFLGFALIPRFSSITPDMVADQIDKHLAQSR